MNYHQPLQADNIYHIYSKAIRNEKLFNNEDNYRFFLMKYKLHISPVANTFAWCLLPNHFHIPMQVKSFEIIEAHFKEVKSKQEMLYNDISLALLRMIRMDIGFKNL